MLQITGQPKMKATYARVPMHDGIGPVAAYVYDSHVDYYPKKGSLEQRFVRAQLLAFEVGGMAVQPKGERRPFARMMFEEE